MKMKMCILDLGITEDCLSPKTNVSQNKRILVAPTLVSDYSLKGFIQRNTITSNLQNILQQDI